MDYLNKYETDGILQETPIDKFTFAMYDYTAFEKRFYEDGHFVTGKIELFFNGLIINNKLILPIFKFFIK